MVIAANSFTRVTLALDIVQRIGEGPFAGFHELGTIKHQIDLCDTLSIEEADADCIECDDPAAPCDGRNICLKAAALVRERFGIDQCVRIRLQKRIPVMGGLAGGSANAATTIELLNRLWQLGLGASEMAVFGRQLGMDVPFYFVGGTAFDSEAGSLSAGPRLEPIVTGCSFDFVLACPEFGVSTKAAYEGIDYEAVGRRQGVTADLRAALARDDAAGAASCMHNDFELSVFSGFPRLAEIKRELLNAGCAAAFLSGSGSTIIGLAGDRRHAEEVAGKISCRTIIATTRKSER